MLTHSIYLLRANPALTTNVKLVVDSKYNLFLESYNANKELSDNKFKRYQINSSAFLSERIASFWRGIPASLAFQVRNDTKPDTLQQNLANQIDDTYYSGMRQVEDTRYEEEFQYNTTLEIGKSLPKWFFIFRVDGTGTNDIYFKDDVKEQFKVVTYFNLSKETQVGQLWQKNYIDDDILPRTGFELNLKKFEFSKWHGYDYKTGGSVSKSLFMDDFFRAQTTHFEMERFLTEGFQKNEVVYSNQSNISFLFDDKVSGIIKAWDGTPATQYDLNQWSFILDYINEGKIKPSDYTTVQIGDTTFFRSGIDFSYRKRWSINRYYGFYFDKLDEISKISPYTGVKFSTDPTISIVNNKFIQSGLSVDPTLNGWTDAVPIWIKIENTFYLVEKNTNDEFYLISDRQFNYNSLAEAVATSELPIKIVSISTDPSLIGTDSISIIKYIDDTQWHLYPKVGSTTPNKFHIPTEIADRLHLICIENEWYHLRYINWAPNQWDWAIWTDQSITCDGIKLKKKRFEVETATLTTQVLTKNDQIKFFTIYSAQWTEIKDWDFQRQQTDYAKIEYDNEDQVSYNRPFLFEKNYLSNSITGQQYEERGYVIETKWQGNNSGQYQQFPLSGTQWTMPISSEYASTGDLYMLDKNDNLSQLWSPNQSVAKWGWLGSIANMTYPYKINNSLESSGQWNFCPNPYTKSISSQEFSHDWFYTSGRPCFHNLITSINVSESVVRDKNWQDYSLNIYPEPINLNSSTLAQEWRWDHQYYLDPNSQFDIFNWFFNSPNKPVSSSTGLGGIFEDNYEIQRTTTLSTSDEVNGPYVLFRGLYAKFLWIDIGNPNGWQSNSLIFNKIRTSPANDLEGYQFCIYLDSVETSQNDPDLGKAGIDVVVNKIHKSILIFIYIKTPYKAFLNYHWNTRDNAIASEWTTYTYYDQTLLQQVTSNSELKTDQLTLNTLYGILNTCSLSNPNFSLGIKYKVVQKTEQRQVDQTYLSYNSVYDIATDTTEITLKLTNPINLKVGQWIFIKNTLLLPDSNYQVSEIINTSIFKFKISGNLSSILLTNFTNTIITEQVSVIPFKINCLYPDTISIDTKLNIVKGENTCPVQPSNNIKSISGILQYDRLLDNFLVNNVWIDTPLGRKLDRIKRERELTIKQVEQLPVISRYSGDYSPIYQKLNIFDRPTVSVINKSSDGIYNVSLTTYWTEIYNGNWHLVVRMLDTSDNLLALLTSGDFCYLYDPSIIVTNHAHFHAKSNDVMTIKSVTQIGPNKQYDIILSQTFTSNLYPFGPIRSGLTAVFMKPIEERSYFKYNWRQFATTKGQLISKWSSSNSPLKTSNPLYNVANKWPMIDEHGMTTVDRSIFQSSWDKKFLFETNKNLFNNY